MSTIKATTAPAPALPDADPFRHGWRYVKVTRPDGKVEFDQVPLSMEDVLHPEEGDVNLQGDAHLEDCLYLKSAFMARLADNPGAIVLSDCRVDFSTPDVRPLGPDIGIFFDAKRHNNWATFELAAEGARPILVIEITSPDYWDNDFVRKVDLYYRCGVPLYVIVDVSETKTTRHLDFYAFQTTPDGYEPIEVTDRRIWLEEVGLWLEMSEDDLGERVSLYDPERGRQYGTYTAEFERAQAGERHAETERVRADTEERRAETEWIRAEAERRRADAERLRADVERSRAEAIERRSETEREARIALEEQVRQMRAELMRLRGES